MQITLKEWLKVNGYASAEEALADYSELDDVYPALCSEDCQVEPDGHCPHGAPSLLLALGDHLMPTNIPLGQVVATPGALRALSDAGQTPWEFICRHAVGDWGELDAHDRQENERSLQGGCRLLSAYALRDGTRVWVITEADRSSTTLLLPEEY